MAKRHFLVRRRRDANHKAICEALEAAGARIFDLSGVGSNCPDIAVWNGRDVFLMEIKTAKGALKPGQQRAASDWPIHVVRTADEALKVIRRAPSCRERTQ